MADQRFDRSLRLRQKADFDRVYAARLHATDGLLVINAAANDLGRSRLGLAVGRPVGNAVVRNRWKRLIREAFRRERATLPVGFDFVVRPRPGVKPLLPDIVASLRALAARIARRRVEARP